MIGASLTFTVVACFIVGILAQLTTMKATSSATAGQMAALALACLGTFLLARQFSYKHRALASRALRLRLRRRHPGVGSIRADAASPEAEAAVSREVADAPAHTLVAPCSSCAEAGTDLGSRASCKHCQKRFAASPTPTFNDMLEVYANIDRSAATKSAPSKSPSSGMSQAFSTWKKHEASGVDGIIVVPASSSAARRRLVAHRRPLPIVSNSHRNFADNCSSRWMRPPGNTPTTATSTTVDTLAEGDPQQKNDVSEARRSTHALASALKLDSGGSPAAMPTTPTKVPTARCGPALFHLSEQVEGMCLRGPSENAGGGYGTTAKQRLAYSPTLPLWR